MLLTGTGRLVPAAVSPWALQVRDGRIAWVGSLSEAPDDDERIGLGSALVTPGIVDSHTHPVFAGDRSDEAAARLEGAPYSGGGILRTVAATRAADDSTLEALVEERLRAALGAGTTTVECKSGYGLSLEEELRHLRLIRRVAERLPLRVVTTFLGAHAVPDGATLDDYADHVAEDMIPAVAAEGLAEFVTSSPMPASSTSPPPSASVGRRGGQDWACDCTPSRWRAPGRRSSAPDSVPPRSTISSSSMLRGWPCWAPRPRWRRCCRRRRSCCATPCRRHGR